MAKKINTTSSTQGTEEINICIANLRKSKGYTQAELAQKVGTTREVISDYERGKIRPHYKMIVKFAQAFNVTTDELLGVKQIKDSGGTPSLKIQRRMKKIEDLPAGQQKALLKTIDTFIENVQLKKNLAQK